MSFLRFFARHGTAANLLLVVLVVAGLFAALNMRAQSLPDVVTDTIDVTVRWPDASAQQVDEAIIGQMTPPFLNVDGVARMRSVAREGRASFELTFEPGWDIDRALADVTGAMPSVNALPEGAEAPRARRDGWRDRVVDIVLSADLDRAQLELMGEDLAGRLQRAGIPRAVLRGRTAPALTVMLDEEALARHGLTQQDVSDAVSAQSQLSGVGNLVGEATRITAGQEARSAAALRQVQVPSEAGPIPITELAEIIEAQAGTGRAYFLGATPAVSIAISRGADGDALAIADTVDRVLESFLETAPEGTEVALLRNRAAEIEDRLALLIDNAALGLLLVLVLLFLFLSPAAALWVAAGIPVALAAGVAMMWLTGQSLNMISIYALILCLGIIVDDAIVVAEHAEFRAGALGEKRTQAAERAARRMVGPVLASTLTTIIAFMALHFIGGRFGAFIATIPFIVAVILIASLVECFLILPHHMARGAAWLNDSVFAWPSRVVGRGFDWVRDRVFRPFVGLVIAFRYAVILGVVAALSQAVLFFYEGDVRWQFFASPESNTVTANFAMVEGATRADSEEMLIAVEAAVDRVNAEFAALHGAAPVLAALGEIGGNSGRGLAVTEDKSPDLLGAVTLELIDQDARPYAASDFVQALEAALEPPETLEAFSFRNARRGPAEDTLDVLLFGADQARLQAAATDLKASFAAFPEVTGVEDTFVRAGLDRQLTLSPQGVALGFEIGDIVRELRARTQGITAHEFVAGIEEGRVIVRLPLEAAGQDIFDTWRLTAEDGTRALFGEIVEVSAVPAPRSLRRTNAQLAVRVSGDIGFQDAARSEEINAQLAADILPDLTARYGVDTRLEGLAEQEREFISDAALGYLFCLLGIYGALALVLGSWGRPLTIMLVIPAGLIGVLWAHALWGLPLNIFSIVGLMGLSGIIVNDSIVLVTSITEKLPRRATIPATIEASCERLRPVLLTTLTTVLGLAPLLLETSRQAEFLKPMVLTLVSGLCVGFFLVLLIVPALVVIQHDIARGFTSLRRGFMHLRRLRAS